MMPHKEAPMVLCHFLPYKEASHFKERWEESDHPNKTVSSIRLLFITFQLPHIALEVQNFLERSKMRKSQYSLVGNVTGF